MYENSVKRIISYISSLPRGGEQDNLDPIDTIYVRCNIKGFDTAMARTFARHPVTSQFQEAVLSLHWTRTVERVVFQLVYVEDYQATPPRAMWARTMVANQLEKESKAALSGLAEFGIQVVTGQVGS